MKTFTLTGEAARRFDAAGIEQYAVLVHCTNIRTGEVWSELRPPVFGELDYGDLGTVAGVHQAKKGMYRIHKIDRRQGDDCIVVTAHPEPLNPVFVYGENELPSDAAIFSGSGAQAYGENPWKLYVAVNPDGSVDVHGDNLPPLHAFEECYCDPPCEWDMSQYSTLEYVSPRLPSVRPDGSPLEEDDTCVIWVYGPGGSYPEDYVFRDGRWEYVES